MSAEVLREAAALMRERAEAATPGPWKQGEARSQGRAAQVLGVHSLVYNDRQSVALIPGFKSDRKPDAAHIASWHPDVALAVADLLDSAAKWLLPCDKPCWEQGIEGCIDCEVYSPALAVARAYLGTQP